MKGGRRRIDRVTEPSYLGDLAGRPLADVRAMRAECQEEEAVLSYERRLLHARLDIMRAELERRAGKGGPSLVERLPQILADEHRSTRGAFPQEVVLPSFENSRRRVEQVVSDDTLANLSGLPDDRIRDLIATTEEVERSVSADRRRVQQVLDALNAEIGRRYKTGDADPADVLAGGPRGSEEPPETDNE